MAIGGGRVAAAANKVGHRSVLFDGIRSEGMRLSKGFFEGPKDGALSVPGEPNGRM